ncbi:NFX1-type zinc finger-containing protein 1-like [Mytilus edulis]|uniref:NFX1-type zinc finger-containing protein 1-like n=1 Tax=Mytilus edulis TaxID=6550 RepID=UPI0039F125A5
MASKSPGKLQPADFIEKLYKSNLQNEELLEILLKEMNVINRAIDNTKLSDDHLSLLVHLIAKASTCTAHRRTQEVIQLLNMLSDSSLITTRSIPLLVGVTCNNSGDHDFHCLLSDYITILQELYIRMPHLCTTPHVIGLVEFLKGQVNECDDCEDKHKMVDFIFELKNDIMKIAEERSKPKHVKKQDIEDQFTPPEDFRTMSVVPGQIDVLYAPNFLRRNKVNGTYLSLDHYLDVQFRLYREDCVSPLRDALMEFKQKDREIRSGKFGLESGLVYRNVSVVNQSTSIDSGEVFELQLDPTHCKKINWMKSKRLIYGALLLVSFDRFNTIFFAVVADSERETLQKKGCFTVQVFKSGIHNKLPRNECGIMIEATSAYFEAYKHVLKALQRIKEDTFPFQRYLVHCEKDVGMPSYILKDCVYDLRPLIENSRIGIENAQHGYRRIGIPKQTPSTDVRLFQEDWPSTSVLKMDESQRKAFISALTKEFVLIQGPPGTGKTYLGLQIAKALLHNSSKWIQMDFTGVDEEDTQPTRNFRRPEALPKPYMLVVCYTNHALDQFVEGIVNFMPENLFDCRFPRVVRFGARSKNPKIEELSIKNFRRKAKREFVNHRAGVLEKATAAKRKIKEIRETIEALQSRNIVLWFDILKFVLSENHANQFGDSKSDGWLQWLQVLEQSWNKEVNKHYQNQQTDKEIKDQLIAMETEHKEEELITVISESEHAFNERYLEVDDVCFSLNADTIGLDLDMQYENQLKRTDKLEEKCRLILRLEKEKAAKELHYGENMSEDQVINVKNIWILSMEDRWKMYRYWLMQYIKILHEQLRTSEQEFNEIFDDYMRASRELDEFIMQQTTVIAMTTTNAARYSESLNKVGPLITIIEEAAEVPEAHIITAISPRCKHLILIGDHKQLEPKPAVYELATRFNLSVSLFERMVKNELSYHCLQRQHRMRPEISKLVRHIYDVLYDNENVYEYPPIKGVHKSLFFITHNKQEAFKDEGRSFSNEYEAEYLKELCLYLLKQGYKPSDITIIAAYNGQMFCLKEKMPRSKFEGVNICVLDSYQGEENEIILLSLVRSNTKGDIGFLNRENRICVALSRAKQGLFIIGNSSTLTMKSQHWQTIIKKLQIEEEISDENDTGPKYPSIGKALPLYCQNHPSHEGILAESPSDFKKVKDGGCALPCEFRLSCGHACRYDCHPFDKEHEAYKCKKQCSQTCEEGHKCRKRCHLGDLCNCSVVMTRELKCDHTANLQCHVDYYKYLCPFEVTRTLSCGHAATMKCCIDPETIICKVFVDRELKCGHTANLQCHVDYSKYICLVEVTKTLSCGHAATMKCHVDPKRHMCVTVVTGKRSKCGHEFERQCHNVFYEVISDCKVLIKEKRSSCDHVIKRYCFDTKVEKLTKCNVTVTMNRTPCGHEYQRQCHDKLYENTHKCNEIVTKQWLSCKHEYERYCYDFNYVGSHTCEIVIPDKRDDCGHEYVRKCSDTNYQTENKCSVYVEKDFLYCHHKIMLPCHQDVTLVKCKANVTTVFECKHSKTHECHRSNSIKCTVKCNEICKNDHQCLKSCHFPFSCDCKELIETILERCQHQQSIPCSADAKVYPCKTMVKKVLISCGHTQEMECHTDPETISCKLVVLKSLPICRHMKMVVCSANVSDVKCTVEVKIKLEKCGHSATIKCWEKVTNTLPEIKCSEAVAHMRSDCRHTITLQCWKKSSTKIPKCKKLVDKTLGCGHFIKSVCSESKEKTCDQKCEISLPCGHPCPGSCYSCRIKSRHSECKSHCEKELLCGHACQSKACMKCSPCQTSCVFACPHSKCRSKCNDPCEPCKEKCPWECIHYKCTQLCFEECNRQRCCNDCDRTLSCGHLCPGYCGEPCPLQCADCKPDIYIFKDTSKDNKIVTLLQCGHSFESSYLDARMEEVTNDLLSKCPCCGEIICYHPRYEQILKKQKLALEDAKKQMDKVRINSKTLYPVCDARTLKSFERYTTSIATFLLIAQQTQCKNDFDLEFKHAEILTKSILKVIDTTNETSFKTFLQLSQKIFDLHVQWMLCLFTTKPKLLEKYYNADWFPPLVKSMGNASNNFPPELIEPMEIILKENGGRLTDTKGHLTITGRDIVVVVSGMKKQIKKKQIIEILKPFIADMEGDGYLATTSRYPKLQNVVGIHSSDWTICQKGHAMSMIMDSSCHRCEGNDNQQTEFEYYDALHFAAHELTKLSSHRENKMSVGGDVRHTNSSKKLKNPSKNKLDSEPFPNGRGKKRRGRGKGTEKTMKIKTDATDGNASRVGTVGSVEFKRDGHRDNNHGKGSQGYRGRVCPDGRSQEISGGQGRGNNRGRGRGRGPEDNKLGNEDPVGRSQEINRGPGRGNNRGRGRGRGNEGNKLGNEGPVGRSQELNGGQGRGRGRGNEDNKYEDERSFGRSQEFNGGQGRGNNRGRCRGRGHGDTKYRNENRGGRSLDFIRGQGRGRCGSRGRGRGRGHEDKNDGDEIPDFRSREFSRDRHQDNSNDRGRGRGRGENRGGRGRGRRGR